MLKCARGWAWIWLLVGAVCYGDTAYLLEHPDLALIERIRIIRSAQKEILLTTFVTKGDEVNQYVIRELLDAARRGVKVKVQFDAFMNKIDPGIVDVMQAAGIEVRVYNPLTWRFWQYAYRNHGKALVVDGWAAILGGRNQWNESFALGPRPHADMEVLVYGEKIAAGIAEEVRAEFEMAVPVKPRPLSLDDRVRIRYLLENANVQARHFLPTYPDIHHVPIESSEYIADKPGEKLSSADRIEKLIDSANTKIIIETPWIVLSKRFRNAFRRARERGVEITILTNSKETSERPIRYNMTRVRSAKALEGLGVTVYEYSGAVSLHSKYIVVDGQLSYLGSFNLSGSSEYYNMEKGILFHSGPFANALSTTFNNRVTSSKPSPRYRFHRDHVCMHVLAASMGRFY